MKRLISKPKVKFVKELDAVKTVLKNSPKVKLVSEGEEGYFKKEYAKEKKHFLGEYSL